MMKKISAKLILVFILGNTIFLFQCKKDDDNTNTIVQKDCAEVENGLAYLDECGKCVEGTTDKVACTKDCKGVENGLAYLDECGECVGGTTDKVACTKDCKGVFGGTAIIDDCGDCVEGTTGKTKCDIGTGVTDLDGNKYPSVIIGKQEWMAENLKVTQYNDGTIIPLISKEKEWKKNWDNTSNNPMMCWYDNDSLTKKNIHGGLYNWYVVNNDKNICPSGWHIPTNQEWKDLEKYIGVKTEEKLKSITGWKNTEGESYGNGTDNYSFNAIPSGARSAMGSYQHQHTKVEWWSSTSYNTKNAWSSDLKYNNNGLSQGYLLKANGLSIRCIKN